MFRFFILLFFFGCAAIAEAQVNPHKVDSLAGTINAAAKKMRAFQDSLVKARGTVSSNEVVVTERKAEAKEARPVGGPRIGRSILIGIGILSLILLGLWLRQKEPHR